MCAPKGESGSQAVLAGIVETGDKNCYVSQHHVLFCEEILSVYIAGHQEKCFNIKIIIISAETLIFDQLCNLSLFEFEGPFKSISEPREGNVT